MGASLQGYRDVLAYPGAKSLLVLSFITRAINIPIGALLTVISFGISGSWTIAAISGGVASLSSALSFWLSGKAIDIFSPKIILLLFLPGSFFPLLFLLEPEGALIFLVSCLVGASRPPSGTTLRTSWQRVVVKDSEKIKAYGLDSSVAPIAGSLGSAAGALFLLFFSYEGVVILLVFLSFFSTLLLAFHKTSAQSGGRHRAEESHPLKLPKMGIGVWLSVILVALSWGALVGLELLIGERFGPEYLLWFNAAGAILVAFGAFFSGGARDTTGKQTLMGSSLLAGISLVLISLGFFFYIPLVFVPIILFALSRGVISASASTLLSIASPLERRSEALALYGSGVLTGQALYRPAAGAMLLFAPALILLIPAGLFFALAGVLCRDHD